MHKKSNSSNKEIFYAKKFIKEYGINFYYGNNRGYFKKKPGLIFGQVSCVIKDILKEKGR